MFDRFYRADKSRGGNSGKMGLGLAICKALVTAQGGTIAAESAGSSPVAGRSPVAGKGLAGDDQGTTMIITCSVVANGSVNASEPAPAGQAAGPRVK